MGWANAGACRVPDSSVLVAGKAFHFEVDFARGGGGIQRKSLPLALFSSFGRRCGCGVREISFGNQRRGQEVYKDAADVHSSGRDGSARHALTSTSLSPFYAAAIAWFRRGITPSSRPCRQAWYPRASRWTSAFVTSCTSAVTITFCCAWTTRTSKKSWW